MYTLYGYPKTRSERVAWLLEEIGVEYHYAIVDFRKGDNRQSEFRALNPMGKVPVLVAGDLVLTESAAILSYLADQHTDALLIPRVNTPRRAKYEEYMHFVMAEIDQHLGLIGKHKFVLPREKRVADVIPVGAWELQNGLARLSTMLGENPYLLGDAFTAADVLAGQSLNWAVNFKQPIGQTNLIAYQEKLNRRPAYQRAMEKHNTLSPVPSE